MNREPSHFLPLKPSQKSELKAWLVDASGMAVFFGLLWLAYLLS